MISPRGQPEVQSGELPLALLILIQIVVNFVLEIGNDGVGGLEVALHFVVMGATLIGFSRLNERRHRLEHSALPALLFGL